MAWARTGVLAIDDFTLHALSADRAVDSSMDKASSSILSAR